MYGARRPDAMDALGLTDEDYGPFLVWPENMPYVNLMRAVRTQWNLVAGATRAVYSGLIFPALTGPARAFGVDLDTAESWMLIQHAEAAALSVLNRK